MGLLQEWLHLKQEKQKMNQHRCPECGEPNPECLLCNSQGPHHGRNNRIYESLEDIMAEALEEAALACESHIINNSRISMDHPGGDNIMDVLALRNEEWKRTASWLRIRAKRIRKDKVILTKD